MSLFIANNKMLSINGITLVMPEVEAFTFKIDTTKGNGFPSFKIPTISGTVYKFSYRVDYTGAWTPITAWNQPETLITFPSAGIYTIEVRGIIGAWYDNNTGDVQKYVELISFGDTIIHSLFGVFYGATNLKLAGSSTNKLVKKGPNAPNIKVITDFMRGSGINYIPDDIFSRVPNATYINNAFKDCTSAKGNIPDEIFRYTPSILQINGFLEGCSGLTGNIPTDILRYVPKSTIINNFLPLCSGLTGTIPIDILRYVTNVTSLNNFLNGCIGLTGAIPTDMLRYVTNVTSLFGFLQNCKALTGTIPVDMLRYTTLVTNLNGFLALCSGLSGTIPTDMLRYVTNVTVLTSFLFGCSGLTGTIPTDMLMYVVNVTNIENFLRECTKLTGSLPTLSYCKKIVTLNYCMYGLRNMTLPSVMFDLPSINKINNWNNFCTTTFTSYSHTGTLQPIWDYELETATGKSTAFLNCTTLTNYGQLRIEWP